MIDFKLSLVQKNHQEQVWNFDHCFESHPKEFLRQKT